MKKVLFLMLALAVGMTSAFAQVKPNFKAFKKSDAYKTSVSAKVQDLKGREAAPASFAPTEAITRAAVHHAAKGFDEWETMETFYDLQSVLLYGLTALLPLSLLGAMMDLATPTVVLVTTTTMVQISATCLKPALKILSIQDGRQSPPLAMVRSSLLTSTTT